jgi:hypothetical protein
MIFTDQTMTFEVIQSQTTALEFYTWSEFEFSKFGKTQACWNPPRPREKAAKKKEQANHCLKTTMTRMHASCAIVLRAISSEDHRAPLRRQPLQKAQSEASCGSILGQ